MISKIYFYKFILLLYYYSKMVSLILIINHNILFAAQPVNIFIIPSFPNIIFMFWLIDFKSLFFGRVDTIKIFLNLNELYKSFRKFVRFI